MTPQEVLDNSACFDCLSPGVKDTVMLGLLNSIESNTANPPAPPAPVGGATEAQQIIGNASLSSIDSKTPALVSGATPVVASSLPLPSGAATESTLSTLNGKIPTALTTTAGRLVVDGSGVTQPISAASLPLPSGAATETTLGNVLTTSAFQARVPVNGQAAMAASIPVVIASNQSAVQSLSADSTLTTYTQTGVIALNTVLMTVDMLNYNSVVVQCTSMGTVGNVTPEWSADNVNWQTATINTNNGSVITVINAALICVVQRYARYFRLRISNATTGGTTTFAVERCMVNPSYWIQTQTVTGNINLNANTTLVGDVGVQYRTTNTGAGSFVSVQSPATPAAATIKASSGRLVGYYLQNSATGLRSVKLFNATAPTLGTTAASFEIDLPANGIAQIHFEGGIGFSTAMVYSVTSAKGLTDNTSTGLALNDVSGYFIYA